MDGEPSSFTRRAAIEDATVGSIVERVKEALSEEGFGVLCDIDVGAKLEAELGESFDDYRILGACLPRLAAEALETDPSIGALLPCNVIIYESDQGVTVEAIEPESLLGVSGDRRLAPIADKVSNRLDRSIRAIADNRTS